MKKNSIALLIILCCIISQLFCVEWEVTLDTLDLKSQEFVIPAHTVVKGNTGALARDYNIGHSILIEYNFQNVIIDSDVIIPYNTADVFPKEYVLSNKNTMQGKHWVFAASATAVFEQNRNIIRREYPQASEILDKEGGEEEYMPYDWRYGLTDADLYLYQISFNWGRIASCVTFIFNKITKKNSSYEVEAECLNWDMSDCELPENEQPQKGDMVLLYFNFDGDYLDVYVHEVDKLNLIGSFILVDDEFIHQRNVLLEMGRITDFVYTTAETEICKFSSSGDEVIAVVPAGTKVKIKEFYPGKYQKKNTLYTDRVVVELEDGTTGFCPGEYLLAKEDDTFDMSKLTFPRYADGTSDYDDVIIRRQQVNKEYRTIDNLRIRSDENTSSEIITTLEADIKIRVIQIGKQQTIDSITANWVHVQLTDGTTGWCFGGYLREETVAELHEKTEELRRVQEAQQEAESKKKAAQDALEQQALAQQRRTVFFIVIGGIVLLAIVISAVVILTQKKQKK